MAKITRMTAHPIRVPRTGSSDAPPSAPLDKPPVRWVGDYYIDASAFTSVYSRHHETTLVRVETDDGTLGWGEAQSPVAPRVTAAIVEDLVARLVIGRDPLDWAAIWDRLYGAMRERGHPTGFYVDALAGVDIALLDAAGKILNLPAHKLCGGAFREKIPLYAGLQGTHPDGVAAEAVRLVELGYKALKLHLLLGVEECAEIAATVREAVGEKVRLMIDTHMRHTVSSAIALGRKLEDLNFHWFEAPVAAEDVRGQAVIAAALDMAVAIGEWSRTRYEMRHAFEQRAFDIAMHDIARTGITEGLRISSLADAYGVPTAPHVGGGGSVSIAATVQFSAACPNFDIMEHSHKDHELKCLILREPFRPENGFFALPEGSGLGIEVDEKAVLRYEVKS